jgi:hypothetical protein
MPYWLPRGRQPPDIETGVQALSVQATLLSGSQVLNPALPAATDPVPLPARTTRGWSFWVGAAISMAILIAAIWQLRSVDFSSVRAMLPTTPLFWLVFAAAYFTGPAFDWLIFRRLWRIPAAGFAALVRKLIGNELLFGYVGELYLYTWARRRTEMTSAPFGAIKDVTLLSGMVGNATTLILLALAFPLLGSLKLGIDAPTFIGSVALVLLTSSAVLLFRKTLFSLPRGELRHVTLLHVIRIIVSNSLNAVCWHLALPDVGVEWWLVLSALRLLISRLPFVPNKDVVFAGVAVFLIGHDAEIGTLMTMMATLILATHLVLGITLVSAEAIGWKKK